MPPGVGYIFIRDPRTGEEFEAAPGTPIPPGYELVGQSEPEGGQALGTSDAIRDREINPALPQPASFSLPRWLAGLGGPEGTKTFDRGAQAVMERGGPNLTAEDVGGALAGAGVGKAVSPVVRALSKLRIAGTGRAKDAALTAKAVGRAVPEFASDDTVAGLQQATLGGQGMAAVKAGRDRTLKRIAGTLEHRGQQAYEDLPLSGRGVEAVDLPTRDATRFHALLKELADVGRGAYSQTSGELRNVGGTLQKLRTREDILTELRTMLPSDLLKQFETSQSKYSAASELARLFRPGTRVGTPLGQQGLNLPELQRRVANRQSDVATRLGPQFVSSIFRGGRPPVGDRRLSIPISRHGGIRIPLGLEYLAGPGADPSLEALFGLGGVGLGAALSPTVR